METGTEAGRRPLVVCAQEAGGVCLFTGQRGTGKSTELKRLEQVGITVFYADLSEYLLLTKEVEISDFVVSIAGALSEEIPKKYGRSFGDRSYWDRFTKFLETRVELTELNATIRGVGVKAALKADPDFKRRVQEASRGHVAQITRDAHDFMKEAVAFVRRQEKYDATKVVLLIDSVERIRGVGDEAMKVFESVRNLFFGHGNIGGEARRGAAQGSRPDLRRSGEPLSVDRQIPESPPVGSRRAGRVTHDDLPGFGLGFAAAR